MAKFILAHLAKNKEAVFVNSEHIEVIYQLPESNRANSIIRLSSGKEICVQEYQTEVIDAIEEPQNR